MTSALVLVIATALSLAPVAVAHPWQRHHGSQGDNAGQTVAGIAAQWYDITNQTTAAAAYPEPVTQNRAWAVSWLAGVGQPTPES